MARPPLFPDLAASAHLADVQVRQTLALGLLPLGVAVLLMAAGFPPTGLAVTAGLVMALMALLWRQWWRAQRGRTRGFSTLHFLARYFFVAACPVLLWLVFGGTILELTGAFPPILLALLLAIHPVGLILRARSGPDPSLSPRNELARIICQQTEMVLLVLALAGLLSGAVLDANRDYPTEPLPLLIAIWLLAVVVLVAGVVTSYAHASQLRGHPGPPQPLDDPPPAPPADQPARYGSDRF
ncbi:MAG TPA: hypothetical protein PLB42_07810 [Kiritimatiellia bacterium]|nr:hypothetical protein [Kiritimatiellia bacterium]